jgi:DeoR/GlpR family transcriptional regulator of sugar metabolism
MGIFARVHGAEGRGARLKPRDRQSRILDVVARDGETTVDALALSFNVSAETIRRDLTVLAETGALQKVHGGARRLRLYAEGSFQERMADHAQAKAIIAEKLAGVIEPGETLFMDTGSTTLIAAEALVRVPRLTVITNSLRIAQVMGRGEGTRVFLLGGRLAPDNAETVGAMALDHIARFQADLAVVSPAALDAQGPMNADPDEAEVSRAMIAASARTILLAHAAKIGRKAAFRICRMDEVGMLVTDEQTGDAFAAALAAAGVEIR